MTANIRRFEDRDVDPVVGLSLRAWAPVFTSMANVLGQAIFTRLHPDWESGQAQAVKDVCAAHVGNVWVAEVGAQVVGFVAIEFHQDGRTGEISMLAVDPDAQRQGVGTALTEFALARIKDAGMTMAIVETGGDPGHAPARRTYEKAGYTLLPIARYFKAL
ncbi:GNAT family N-acetyltransferase [Actinopolymorpha pittospori]